MKLGATNEPVGILKNCCNLDFFLQWNSRRKNETLKLPSGVTKEWQLTLVRMAIKLFILRSLNVFRIVFVTNIFLLNF